MVGAGVRAAPGPSVSGVVAHGWNMSSESLRGCLVWGGCVGGTLLGPEGTGAGCPAVWWGGWCWLSLVAGPWAASHTALGCGELCLPVLGLWVGVGVCGCRVVFENWIVVANELHLCFVVCVWCGVACVGCGVCSFDGGQVVKGTRWMSWHQEPMKDVGGCVKPRGAANRALIRGCPNGGTRPQSCGVTAA